MYSIHIGLLSVLGTYQVISVPGSWGFASSDRPFLFKVGSPTLLPLYPHLLEHLLCILILPPHPNCLLIPQIYVFMFVLSLECILCKGRDHFQCIHHCISKNLGQHLAPSSYLINICLVDESRKSVLLVVWHDPKLRLNLWNRTDRRKDEDKSAVWWQLWECSGNKSWTTLSNMQEITYKFMFINQSGFNFENFTPCPKLWKI